MEKRIILQCDMVQSMYVIQGDIIRQLWPKSKFCFLYAQVQSMSELYFKFQVPASNTLGEVAETRIVLRCDMVQNM